MKTYKDFDKNLKCRDFQYEPSVTYEETKADLCLAGFHACKRPLDVFAYYPPGAGSRYCAVDLAGVSRKRDTDSKLVGKKITVGAELGVHDLVKAQIEYVKAHTTEEHTDPKLATAGNGGAATSRGSNSVGKNGIACARGNGCRIHGGLGAVLVIAEENGATRKIKSWKTVTVDGENIKADTWYRLNDSELEEIAE